jgi:zinc protease
MGVLPNGLRYYIQRHPQPAKRAELRLAVNAGGINEDDDQVGMAHLIEHMGFNGTTHFKKNDLIDYLRSVGVRFGADLNAGTSTDETVYMLQIPSDTARILEQGIIVLSDWASGSLFDSTEVANERGVVVEEWRGGQARSAAMRHRWRRSCTGLKYATRDVIGTDRSIMSATPALLKRFYNDWYRPDLQAVVVVGDVDVAAVEALIKNTSPLSRPIRGRGSSWTCPTTASRSWPSRATRLQAQRCRSSSSCRERR